ncbi:MAG: hypothetical protein Q8L22_26965 [Reyranella sp.]|nr:hypothetical protein [Reyranella sp.]
MTLSEHELFYGPGSSRTPERIEALSWAEAAEETRPQREAQEAEQSARRIAAAPDAIRRALAGPPKRRTPGRLRVAFLRQLGRWGTLSQATAAIGVDVRTIQRWRGKLPAFNERCVTALAGRAQMLEDEGIARARTKNVRPFFFTGKKVGEVESYDNKMLVHMLSQVRAQQAQSAPIPTPAPAPVPSLDPAAFATALGNVLAPILRGEMQHVLDEQRRHEMSRGAGQAESDPFPML